MDKARFEAMIAAYGADARRWPAEERDAARAYAAETGADLSEARIIDALLDAAPQPAAPSDLLMARLKRGARTRRWSAAPQWALAACMLAGLLIGYGAGLSAPAQNDADEVVAAAFDMPLFEGEDL